MAFSKTYNTTNPGAARSNREDLTEILSVLAPEETPALSNLSKKKANAMYTEWTTDSLDGAQNVPIEEGEDVTTFDDKFANRARLGNYIQKFRRSFGVSDLQEAVESVGPAKIAQAEAKAIRELKRDVEKAILSSSVKTVGADGTASALGGLGAWIDDTPHADMGIPSGYHTPAGSINAASEDLTEDELNALITSIYRENGEANSLVLLADTGLRRTVSDFARLGDSTQSIRNVNYVGGSSEIKVSVDLYQSDHGVVSIMNMNPACADPTQTGAGYSAGFLLNLDYAGIHELVTMGSSRLPNLGGGERGYVDCALTLGVYHPKAHGKLSHA